VKKTKTKKKVVKKNKKIVKKSIRKPIKIEPDQLLLHSRRILLFGPINTEMARNVIKQLLSLDALSNKPITMMINSGGGSVSDGFAIIDTMNGIKAPVVTCITGAACSMAGLISIAGEVKVMTTNSVWMAHDVATANHDYVTKYLARAANVEELQRRIFTYLSSKTKLTPADLAKAKNEELWLYAEDARKKGIVDDFIRT